MGVLKGMATVFTPGASPTVTWVGIATNAGGRALDAEVSDESEVEELKTASGKLAGFFTPERRLSCTINFYPVSIAASNPTQSQAAGAAILPVGPCKVTLSGFPDTATPSNPLNGDWIYKSGAKCAYNDKQAKLTLPLISIVGMTPGELAAILADIAA